MAEFTEQQIRQLIREEMGKMIDRIVFDKNIQILDGRKIQCGRTNGLIIASEGYGDASATDAGQKLAFFNETPIVQQAHIADPSGGTTTDTQARTVINSILTILESFGFTRSS